MPQDDTQVRYLPCCARFATLVALAWHGDFTSCSYTFVAEDISGYLHEMSAVAHCPHSGPDVPLKPSPLTLPVVCRLSWSLPWML